MAAIPAVRERVDLLERGYREWALSMPGKRTPFPGAPYVLLHSLSHLLMAELAMECGYPASSLKERIYALTDEGPGAPSRCGFLIYAASIGAQGTLGGLVATANRRLYEFEVIDGVVPPNAQLHLRKVDDTGTEQVLRRRLRMLGTLATQSELALMLADPRGRLRSYRDDPPVEDFHFAELDTSKQDALRSIWSTGPGQFVVGPPGVGKTRLVTEIVRRVLAGDPTARLLLSAQAHQALDHLAAAVQKTLKAAGLADDVILVRSRADAGADLSGAQTPERAKAYLAQFHDSPLLRSAPLAIRQSLVEMTAAADVTGNLRAKLPLATLRQRRSFEALVLQSANVLFSTTNSGDLERLIEDRV